MEKVKYEISVPPGTPPNVDEFKRLIEANRGMFENFVMGAYRGDYRYSYFPDNFEVTEVNVSNYPVGTFSFSVDVVYYEGCKDKNDTERLEFDIEYEVINKVIHFSLDELVWKVDN
jgi:hypothetical protein